MTGRQEYLFGGGLPRRRERQEDEAHGQGG